MVGDSEEELWTETASLLASSSAIVASVAAGEDRVPLLLWHGQRQREHHGVALG